MGASCRVRRRSQKVALGPTQPVPLSRRDPQPDMDVRKHSSGRPIYATHRKVHLCHPHAPGIQCKTGSRNGHLLTNPKPSPGPSCCAHTKARPGNGQHAPFGPGIAFTLCRLWTPTRIPEDIIPARRASKRIREKGPSMLPCVKRSTRIPAWAGPAPEPALWQGWGQRWAVPSLPFAATPTAEESGTARGKHKSNSAGGDPSPQRC